MIRRRPARGCVGAVTAAALALAACTGGHAHTSSSSSEAPAAVSQATSSAGAVRSGRTIVSPGTSTVKVTVTNRELTPPEQAAVKAWPSALPLAVGRPVQLTTADALPAAGVTITRTYLQPLPPGSAATLAYFDPALGAWHAVPSTLAADRRSVSAVVHHFSLWTDFASGVSSAWDTGVHAVQTGAQNAADWAYYQVGKIFDTRVDAPSCTGGKASWLSSASFIATDRNNPLLFCTGTDPKNPDLVVVKARVNRGFGFNAELHGDTTWSYNSTLDPATQADILHTLGNIDQDFADSFRQLTDNGGLVGPGQELDVGISEAQARSVSSGPVLRLRPQPVLSFLMTTLAQLVGVDLTNKGDGYAAAAIALAKCSGDVKDVTSGGSLAKAALSCVSGLDDAIAKKLAVYLLDRGVHDAGKVAGKVIGKLSVYLALIGPVFSSMNYFAELHTDDAAHTATLFPRPASTRPIETKTITALGENPASYRMSLWATDNLKGNCAQHSYGQLVAYFRAHECRAATRYLWTFPHNGRTVALAVESLDAAAGPFNPDPNNTVHLEYEWAIKLVNLENAPGTGGINDLLREGHRIPGVSATTIPADEVFQVQNEDNGVCIFDAWYTTGPTDPNDPDLMAVEQGLYLTEASFVRS